MEVLPFVKIKLMKYTVKTRILKIKNKLVKISKLLHKSNKKIIICHYK